MNEPLRVNAGINELMGVEDDSVVTASSVCAAFEPVEEKLVS